MPFGRKEAYAKEVVKANLERLAHLNKSMRLPNANKSFTYSRKLASSKFFLTLAVGYECFSVDKI
jgi:hypothetical protein